MSRYTSTPSSDSLDRHGARRSIGNHPSDGSESEDSIDGLDALASYDEEEKVGTTHSKNKQRGSWVMRSGAKGAPDETPALVSQRSRLVWTRATIAYTLLSFLFVVAIIVIATIISVKNSHLEDQLEKDEAILATSTSYTPTATLGFASVPTATGVFKQFPELQELIVGNRRFRNETETEHPGEIQELAQAQHPKFAYLGCADSRVPATTIFDADIGDLFVHRNVGNQYAVDDLNSQTVISYAVEHLLVSHIIVMGHYACGAVQAAIASVSKEVNKDVGATRVENWISPIRRLFDTSNRSEIVEFRKAHADDETVAAPNQTEPAALVEENVAITVSSLAADESVRKMWEEWIISNAGGAEKAKRSSSEKEVPELYIHGMVYDVATGLVTDLGLSLGPSHFIVSSNEGHEEE